MKLFGLHVHAPILLLAAAEYSLASLAFLVATMVLFAGNMDSAPAAEGVSLSWVFGFSTTVMIGLTAFGLYRPKQRLRVEGIALRLLGALAMAAVALSVLDLLVSIDGRSLLWALSFALSLLMLVFTRVLYGRFVDHDAFRRHVLVLGAGDRAACLLQLRRRSDQRGFRIEAFLSTPGDRRMLNDPRVVAAPEKLLDFAKSCGVDEIVVAMDERRAGLPIWDLLECKFNGIAVVDVLSFLERETGKVKVDLVNPAWLIFSDDECNKGRIYRTASRGLDVVVAALLACLALPVMLLVAAAIFLEDGMPMLYRQQRVGLGGRKFTLLKFRSMIKNAESDGRPQWADARDSRVTRVGRIIRKLRLDELPQLLNVLRGDMSLVGPRPERPEFVEQLARCIPYYHKRHIVKPGVTGWAQLCYPYGSSEGDALEKLQYDLYYVKHRSLVFDVMVILQTVEVVLWGKGAR